VPASWRTDVTRSCWTWPVPLDALEPDMPLEDPLAVEPVEPEPVEPEPLVDPEAVEPEPVIEPDAVEPDPPLP